MPSVAISVIQIFSICPFISWYGENDSKTVVNSRLRFFTSTLGTFFILAAGVPSIKQIVKAQENQSQNNKLKSIKTGPLKINSSTWPRVEL
jgi:hypothetical protein